MNIKLTEKDKIRVENPKDIFGIMQRILKRENKIDREKEHFWIVGLNQAGTILYIELVSLGSTRATVVDPMNVYRVAILKNATRVIAVHNHPSLALNISKEDEDLTDRLMHVGDILGITMEDHLIITPEKFISFRAMGIMEILAQSTKYVPTYKVIERVRKEEQAIREEALKTERELREKERLRREEAEKGIKKAVEYLIQQGTSVSHISDILSTSLQEIEKITKK